MRCVPAGETGTPLGNVRLLVNRSPTITTMRYQADSNGLYLGGCGFGDEKHVARIAPGAKRAIYDIVVSVITPHLRLMNDGKTPFLGDFKEAVREAVKKAANAAYRNMVRPPRKMSFKDAAWQVMEDAYNKASNNGELPANARQIMYAARGAILALTGKEKLDDHYFTQTLLPDYIREHPDKCRNWDVVFDARGHFVEPHTNRSSAMNRSYKKRSSRSPSGSPAKVIGCGSSERPRANPFDFVRAILERQDDPVASGELDIADYNPYIVNRACSFRIDALPVVQLLNKRPWFSGCSIQDFALSHQETSHKRRRVVDRGRQAARGRGARHGGLRVRSAEGRGDGARARR